MRTRMQICCGLLLLGGATTGFGQVFFTEVANQVGIGSNFYGGALNHSLGINWIDFDKDGWDDLFLVNGFNRDPHLFHNEGDGTFTNMDFLLPALTNVEMMGSTFADYDNDGDSDIYIFTDNNVALGSDGPAQLLLKNLWMEQGQTLTNPPLFEEVGSAAGVDDLIVPPIGPNPAYRSATGGWFDYDRDGNVDLYVSHWDRRTAGHTANVDRLFRNLGNGTFEDTTVSSGVHPGSDTNTFRPVLAFIAAHLDDDLWPDIYVANAVVPPPYHYDFVYENNGNGTLTNIVDSLPGIGDDAHAAMGVAVGDVDLDGDWDVYITDLYDNGPLDAPPNGNVLYLGNGGSGLSFTDNQATNAGVQSFDSWGCNFLDANHDGYEDLFVATMALTIEGVDRLYLNDQDGTFTEYTNSVGFTNEWHGRGSAVSDYDNDGDLDIAVISHNGEYLELYRNDSVGIGNWLKVRLKANTSNRDGFGTIVKASAGGLNMMRQVVSRSSAHSQDSLTLHFGLGAAQTADYVHVLWPSGLTDIYTNVPADTTLTACEGETFVTVLEQPAPSSVMQFTWSAASGKVYQLQGAYTLDGTTWSNLVPAVTGSAWGMESIAVSNAGSANFFRLLGLE